MCVTRTRKRSGLQTKVDIRELCGAPVSALLAQTWVALHGRLRIWMPNRVSPQCVSLPSRASSAALTGCMCASTTEDALCSASNREYEYVYVLGVCVHVLGVCVCVCVCVCALEPDSRRMGVIGQRESCTVECVWRGGGGRWEDGGTVVQG